MDNDCVGQLICTKSINSDRQENLTQAYKAKKRPGPPSKSQHDANAICLESVFCLIPVYCYDNVVLSIVLPFSVVEMANCVKSLGPT